MVLLGYFQGGLPGGEEVQHAVTFDELESLTGRGLLPDVATRRYVAAQRTGEPEWSQRMEGVFPFSGPAVRTKGGATP